MKTCIKCRFDKPPSEFNRHAKYPDGLYSICKLCHRAAARQWELNNPKRVKARLRADYLANRRARIDKAREWYLANKEHVVVLRRARYKRDPSKIKTSNMRWQKNNHAKVLAMHRAWWERHPEVNATRCAKRHASKLLAIPHWANHGKIAEIYQKAKRLREETGADHHVDHVVPLRSRLVCGLHWEGNLQVLTKTANLRKRNITWPDMPGSNGAY
jgi:hypothetical protein